MLTTKLTAKHLHVKRTVTPAALLLAVAVLAGSCSSSARVSGRDGSVGGSPGVVEPSFGPGSPAPPFDPGVGTPVEVVPGRVTVAVARTAFSSGEVILAIVANGLDRIIYSEDSKSDCTIVTIERRGGSGWEPIAGCTRGLAPATLAIGPGLGRALSIDPSSANFGVIAGAELPAFGPGDYRIAFSYAFSPQGGAEGSNTVHSAELTIR